MRISYLLLAACLSACSSCEDKQGTTAANGSTSSASGTAATATPGCPPARTPDDWHTVDSLIVAMGGVNGKTVADLFVGDGYYTMKLLEAGAKVIASDDDPRNIEALRGVGPRKACEAGSRAPRYASTSTIRAARRPSGPS